MGIYINMRLSSSLTQEEWEPVYKTSLEMAEKMQLYFTGIETIRNNKVKCIIPVREIARNNMFRDEEKGWFVSGSMPEFRFAETQFTPKIICSENKAESVYSDISYQCTIVLPAKDIFFITVKNDSTLVHFLQHLLCSC